MTLCPISHSPSNLKQNLPLAPACVQPSLPPWSSLHLVKELHASHFPSPAPHQASPTRAQLQCYNFHTVSPHAAELAWPAPCICIVRACDMAPSPGPSHTWLGNSDLLRTHLISSRLRALEVGAACGSFLHWWEWVALHSGVKSCGFKSQLCYHYLWDLGQIT